MKKMATKKTRKRVVAFVSTGSAVKVKPTDVRLIYGGEPWPEAGAWSLGADAFKKLQRENPDVEFVEKPK